MEQVGELIIFRVKNNFYSIYYITHKERNEQNHKDLEAILDSIVPA